MKQIVVPEGVKKKLTVEFEVGYDAINRALSLTVSTKRSNAIRKRAFELGGKLEEVEQIEIEQPK